jgi:hypothetical protein
MQEGMGIIAYRIKKEKEFARSLAAKNVIIAANFGRVVVSPYFFNSKKDMEGFLELTRAYDPS